MSAREQLPGRIFAILPITLFFPIGLVYAVVVLYIIVLLATANLRDLWFEIRRHPVYTPNLLLLAIVLFSAIFLSDGNEYRWSGVVYYLIFTFMLLFASGCKPVDYARAKIALFVGGVYAAVIFCLAKLVALPDWVIFSYYNVYAGNKSISIGIFMAIIAAWMLNDVFNTTNRLKMFLLLVAFTFIEVVVVQLAVTRTGTLLVYLLSALVLIRRIRFDVRSAVLVALSSAIIVTVAISDGVGNRRLQGAAAAVAAAATEQHQPGFGVGESNRLQFLKVTGEMIVERPLLGFGIGGWRQQYPVRARELETAMMSTPHNDYLLYGAELGVFGLLILGLIFAALLRQAWRSEPSHGNALLMVTVALMVSSLFNAMLRDWRFGMPAMLLLAIAYRESVSSPDMSSPKRSVVAAGTVE